MQEMQVQSLGGEHHLEKELATHSSILAWKIPWTEEPARLQSMGSQRARHDLATKQQQGSLEKMLISNEKAQSQMPRTEERGWAVHMEVNQSSVWGCQVMRGGEKTEGNQRSKKEEKWNMRKITKGKNMQQTKGRRENSINFSSSHTFPIIPFILSIIPLPSESPGKPYLHFNFLLSKLGCFNN